jgi:hypothetical protein
MNKYTVTSNFNCPQQSIIVFNEDNNIYAQRQQHLNLLLTFISHQQSHDIIRKYGFLSILIYMLLCLLSEYILVV